jgi:hypothetical protein
MGTIKVTLYLRMEIIFVCITYIFHPIFIKVPYRRSGQDFICGWEFRENRYSESHTYGHERISIPTSEIYFSIYVKLGKRGLKTILLNIF